MKLHYLFLIGGLLLSAFSVQAATSDYPLSGDCGRKVSLNADSTNLHWEVNLSQHKLTITGKGRMKDYTTDTKAPWYNWRDKIQTVEFPNGMTTVGAYAFYYCDKLTLLLHCLAASGSARFSRQHRNFCILQLYEPDAT